MTDLKKAAIIIDDHKLEVFERHLKASGYEYKWVEGPTEGALTMTVMTTNLGALQAVLQKASAEAAGLGGTVQ